MMDKMCTYAGNIAVSARKSIDLFRNIHGNVVKYILLRVERITTK